MTPHPSKRALLLASVACCALVGQAPTPVSDQEAGDLNALMALLNTPISSASKHEERAIEAPSVVSVAVRDQVEAYGWTSLNDLLYTLPGFSASQDYDRQTVSSRGLFEGWNNNHLLMQVDGIPFNDNIYGSAYTWEITPIFLARTVEVVRGPGSALYGSNAMNGVVQLKTISAKDLPNSGVAEARLGQDNLQIYDFALGVQNPAFSTVIGFQGYQSDGNSYTGYDGSGRTTAAGALATFNINDGKNSQYAWTKIEGEGDLRGLVFQYHLQDWNFKTGHGWLWQVPDLGENLQERRQIAALTYSGELAGGWHQEYLWRHQVHDIDWNMRFYPDGAFVTPGVPGSGYPNGVSEFLDTSAYDDFLRAQWSLDLPRGSSLLFGFEGDRFLYQGDRSHTSNANLVTLAANPGGVDQPQGPWLAWVLGRPMTTTGFYAQYDSGKFFSDKFKTVVGLRADRLAFKDNVLDGNENPTGAQNSLSYANTSPRVALVLMPTPDLALKVMGGRAFRSPAPAELAGANTLTLGSNINGLKPETLTTYEGAVDWIVNPWMNWNSNLFWTRFANEIAYSASNANLSTNVYSLTTEGLESELLFGFGPWKGFLNYSYAKRMNETILDQTIAPSKDVTWVPSQMEKFGLIYASGAFTGSLQGSYTGRVLRRASDVGSQPLPLEGSVLDMDDYRPTSVSPFFTLNSKLTYAFTRQFSASLVATNLLNKSYFLDKTLAFPFDYQGAQRNVSVVLKVNL